MKKNNTLDFIAKFIKYWNISKSEDQILEELLKHPDYPSLLSVSDVITTLGIPNDAYEVDEIAKLTCPFIAHTNVADGDLVLITKMDKDSLLITGNKWKNDRIKKSEFSIMFDGIALTGTKPPADKIGYSIDILEKIKIPLIVILLALCSIYIIFFRTNFPDHLILLWQQVLLFIFKSAGLVVSILLLIQSFDNSNPFISKLCNYSSKTNCDSVLSSEAAMVFDGLTWSEVGFFYFSGTWLLMVFGSNLNTDIQIMAVINILSLPYTFYSIYYQAKVIKQWCVLCCAIQALLWMEFFTFIADFHGVFILPEIKDIANSFIAFTLPGCLWLIIKPLLNKVKQVYPLKQQLHLFKYNRDIFISTLNDQRSIEQPAKEWTIVLGDQTADTIITLVTNPFCSPCSDAHKIIDEYLELRPDFQIRLVFGVKNQDNDQANLVARYLMEIYALQDTGQIKNALRFWYAQKNKDFSALKRIFPITSPVASQSDKIDWQQRWCNNSQIAGTPAIFINGQLLPEIYRLEDLKYMLDGIKNDKT